jgi:predicted MFS family arabinose efflux permease
MVPVSPVSVILFSASLGLLWLSTVPLTSGLVAQMFGPRYMGTLFGIVFLNHQIGSFLGVWLGGYFFDTTGSYMPVWWAGVALGVIAALVHFPIKDQEPAVAVKTA